jgi:hypothetical protein
LVASGLHSGPLKILLCSPQGFTASRWSKINLLEHFLLENLYNQILVEQGKVQLFLEKLCHFSEKKSQKSGIRSGILKYFFAILKNCSTTVHLRIEFRDTK